MAQLPYHTLCSSAALILAATTFKSQQFSYFHACVCIEPTRPSQLKGEEKKKRSARRLCCFHLLFPSCDLTDGHTQTSFRPPPPPPPFNLPLVPYSSHPTTTHHFSNPTQEVSPPSTILFSLSHWPSDILYSAGCHES